LISASPIHGAHLTVAGFTDITNNGNPTLRGKTDRTM
jgi:hypothetical protein